MSNRFTKVTYNNKPFYGYQGRIGRIRFLAYAFMIIIPLCLLIGLYVFIVLPLLDEFEEIRLIYIITIMVIVVIVCIYSHVVISNLITRRLNDMNYSSWLTLLLLVPGINIIFILCLIFMKGNKYDNKYGASAEPAKMIHYIFAIVLPIAIAIGVITYTIFILQ